MFGWAQIAFLANWLKDKIGWTATTVVTLILSLGWYAWMQHSNELQWHAWAQTEQAHYFSATEYEDGKVRVYWERFPKVPACDFSEVYFIKIPGREIFSIDKLFHEYDDAAPYRVNTSDYNVKKAGFWGSWIDVSNYIVGPGKYEIELHYRYDCWNWGVSSWETDQKIVFEVEADDG